jgi:hypothetical protein
MERRFIKLMAPQKRQEEQYLDKVDFKRKLLRRDKEGHFTLIKAATHQEEITNTNLYAPNVSAPNISKHILKNLKSHIDINTVVIKDYNTCQSRLKNQQRNPRTI